MLSCASSKVDSSSTEASEQKDYKTIAVEKYGENVSYVASPEGRYMLCVKEIKGTAKQPRNQVKYFVFDTQESSVVREENLGAGYVKWFNETKLETFKTPGIMKVDQTSDDIAMLYDLVSGKSMTKRQFLEAKSK